ncbi:hypothetical protein ACFV9D_34435 [Streptomyces sp. NPDC059875]|uniref:hypothetical protein n=1 Tax=unclassified Streptomyces TaxID=2593676 RepID=UPI0036491B58
MKVFISWSGPQSKLMAESLKSWLKFVIQAVDPFVSSLDIAKGDRGLRVIASELEQTSFGIICVTRENSQAPWINFEAGALSKALGESRVIPCLLDLPVKDLTGPLAQFQATSSASREDVLAMVRAIRDHANLKDLNDVHLEATFDAFWSRLEENLERARNVPTERLNSTPVRAAGEILEEVLVLTRRQEGVLRTLFERVDSSVPMLKVKQGPDSENERKTHRAVIDMLIASLGIPHDSALSYRVVTERTPEEYQVVYEAGAISARSAEQIRDQLNDFVATRRVHVSIKSKDGFEIIAGPGKETLVLPPADPPAPGAIPRAGQEGAPPWDEPAAQSRPTPGAWPGAASPAVGGRPGAWPGAMSPGVVGTQDNSASAAE